MLEGQNILNTSIEFLKGVGPQKAELLKKDLKVSTFEDLLSYFPFRYVDKTQITAIKNLHPDSGYVQIKAKVLSSETIGVYPKSRMVVRVADQSGRIELVWFNGIKYVQNNLNVNHEYLFYGKVNLFNNSLNIQHPDYELFIPENQAQALTLDPVYNTTEKLRQRGFDPKGIGRTIQQALQRTKNQIPETLPASLISKYKLLGRAQAFVHIHKPHNKQYLEAAIRRIKFEELFLIQMRLLLAKHIGKSQTRGHVFTNVGEKFNTFYKDILPFELTGAQKRVVKEIRNDFITGAQMNRLVQGDVGSGKTMVAFLAILIAIDNGFQCCMMAPTEILANQHYEGLQTFGQAIGIKVELLTGSIKGKKRKLILENLESGEIDLLVGTHALIEPNIIFKNLGLAIIDEQHRFGVEQRAKLWKKNSIPPHVLVMTATPIPRTLAMTLYGDLDLSIIDEMPLGRKPIKTIHQTDAGRLRVFGFMKEQIALGRQIYVVYPMIEESENLDLKFLMDGFESISRAFPMPEYQVSILHGQMKSDAKAYEMDRFKNGQTNIMVATTVIEVGVNVPNASVMVIESAERFGLSQLHQLRGRVGRGADQSYCILMTKDELNHPAKRRINTMVATNDGFKIAEVDMELRGPGDLAGTQQSGIIDFKLANLVEDGVILQHARQSALEILEEDPKLLAAENKSLKNYLAEKNKNQPFWAKIS